MRDSFWTNGRFELLRRLREIDVDLADFYEQVIEALCPRPITRARLVVAAHALREFISFFPHAVGDTTGKRINDSRVVKELQMAWSEAKLPPSLSDGQNLPELPPGVQSAVLAVISQGTQITANARSLAAVVATGVWEDRRDVTLDRFFAAIKRLQEWAHAVDYTRGVVPLPSAARIEQELEIVESALRTRLGDLAELARQTSAVLLDANAQEDGEWPEASPELIDRALAPLANPALRRLFFSGLLNPRWLEALDQRGAFAVVPEPAASPEGQFVVAWPQSEYLVRTAALEPKLTREILARHASSAHPWFQRDLLRAALEMPAEEAARLVSGIARALETSQLWLPEQELVQLAQKLADGDRPKKLRELLNACFRPHAKDLSGSDFSFESAVETPLDHYWHSELLPKLTSCIIGFGLKGLTLVTGWLEAASEFERDGRPEWDLSRMRASVAAHEQNHDTYETINAYVDAVRDVAAGLLGLAPEEALGFLRGRSSQIMQRITLETYATYLRATPSAVADRSVGELVLDPRFLDMDYRPEYLHLAREVLSSAGAKLVQKWADLVLGDSWQLDEDTIRRIVAYPDGEAEDVTATDIDDWRDRTRFRLLQPLAGVLPTNVAAVLADLSSRFPEVEHPEFSSYVSSSWVGPTTPKTTAELGTLSYGELITFLQEWAPNPGDHFGPSIEGLARTIEELAATNPDLVAHVAPAATQAHRAYTRAAVSGLAKALQSGYRPDGLMWSLLAEIAAKPDTGDAAETAWADDDPVWRWAQRSAANFVDDYLKLEACDLTLADAKAAWAVIEPLCSHPDPSMAHEKRFGGENMDPLTFSLNTTRPVALGAACRLVQVISSDEADPAQFVDLQNAVLEVLDAHVGADRDPSLATAAVLGRAVGNLHGTSPDWVADRYDKLFGVLQGDEKARNWADACTSVALHSYYPRKPFLDLVRPVLMQMFSIDYSEITHIEGMRGRESTLETAILLVLNCYISASIDLDDSALAKVFAGGIDSTLVAKALGHLGWQLMRTELDYPKQLTGSAVARTKELIDSRLAAVDAGDASIDELASFFWFVRVKAIDASWWLPVLRRALKAEKFEHKGMIGPSLANAAKSYPTDAVAVLDALTQGATALRAYDLVSNAPRIIAAALDGFDTRAAAHAQQVLDRLTGEGHVNLVAEVDQIRTRGEGGDEEAAPDPDI